MTRIVRKGEDTRLIHPACIHRGLFAGIAECPG
jgi:hypothetical protein